MKLLIFLEKKFMSYICHIPGALSRACPNVIPCKVAWPGGPTQKQSAENNAKSEADLSASWLSGCSTARRCVWARGSVCDRVYVNVCECDGVQSLTHYGA